MWAEDALQWYREAVESGNQDNHTEQGRGGGGGGGGNGMVVSENRLMAEPSA